MYIVWIVFFSSFNFQLSTFITILFLRDVSFPVAVASSLAYLVRLAQVLVRSALPSLCPSGLRSVAADLAADLVDPALAALAAVAVVAVVVPAAVVAGLGSVAAVDSVVAVVAVAASPTT